MFSSFFDRFRQRAALSGPFCLGVDPTPAVLAHLPYPHPRDALAAFCERVYEGAVASSITLVKIQAAYFERLGPFGVSIMHQLIAQCRSHGILVIADVKRGDIASTALAYAEAYMGDMGGFGADAMTVLPWMGCGAMELMFRHAAMVGACVFVVVRSSNPEGRLFQQAHLVPSSDESYHHHEDVADDEHEEAASYLARWIDGWNRRHLETMSVSMMAHHDLYRVPYAQADGLELETMHRNIPEIAPEHPRGMVVDRVPLSLSVGPIAAVLGATLPSLEEDALRMPTALYLTPGIGTQGATMADLYKRLADHADRVIPTAARSLLASLPDCEQFRDCLLRAMDEANGYYHRSSLIG